MKLRMIFTAMSALCIAQQLNVVNAAEPLTVVADFEGASVHILEIDQASRNVSFTPGGEPSRGWPCWWFFRIDGIEPGETITLRLKGSTATVGKSKPLASYWAMPTQAAFSTDGKTWLQTAKAKRQDGSIIYSLAPDANSVFVAWGPPYTSTDAAKFMEALSKKSPHARLMELCRSREDRSAPMLHIQQGDRKKEERFGVWVQARQHAWESGSSWVAQGFAEWVISDNERAEWLRQHAEIFIIPVMDIDNVATGNGGKNAIPHDHNRDWSPKPHWNEVMAAQRKVSELIDEERMDVFLDLHNPGPNDATFFFSPAKEVMKKPAIALNDRFMELAHLRINKIRPMNKKPRVTGPSYHPLWRQISSNWVGVNGNPKTVSLCLETAWNHPTSNTAGYRAVGANLADAVQAYLAERHENR